MDKPETIKQFNGYGSGGHEGEYYYSQGFRKSRFGAVPGWKISEKANSGTLTNLGVGNFFAQVNFAAGTKVFAVGNTGYIFSNDLGVDAWEQAKQNTQTSSGNGLLCDGKNRLLYPSNQYLGMYDGATWTDNWKDFGASLVDYRDGDMYEDWALFGNDNKIAGLNITDDSWNTNLFNMPSGFRLRSMRTGRNGVLLGFNFGARGALVLWAPGYTRSIAPWIWVNSNIQSIALDPNTGDWIVISTHQVLRCNGYTTTAFPNPPDFSLNSQIFEVKPKGATVVGTSLIIANGDIAAKNYNRRRPGFMIMDLTTGLYEYAPVGNGCQTQVSAGAVFLDSNNKIHVSYATNNPSTKFIGTLTDSAPAQAVLVVGPFGSGVDKKTAGKAVIDAALDSLYQSSYNITVNVTAKVYTFRRQLWNYAVESGLAPEKNQLVVNGGSAGFNNAAVGDEVTILEGVNAGQVRHITAIEVQPSTTEIWTLDSNLPEKTENAVAIAVQPWKKVKTITMSNVSELRELEFSIRNKLQGRKFLLKLLFENMGSHAAPEIHEIAIIYDDQGA